MINRIFKVIRVWAPVILLAVIDFLVIPCAHAITVTKLVSMNSAGTDSCDDDSNLGTVSPDGRYVAFLSTASDLVSIPTGGLRQVYVRDVVDGTTTLASVNASGLAGGNDSCGDVPVFSGNSRFLVFMCDASDLVAVADTNGMRDVFLRDLATGTTRLVSVTAAGNSSGNNFSNSGTITYDGRFVAFQSEASDLVGTDTNGKTDVFVRDMLMGTTTLVSSNISTGDSGNGQSTNPQISSDGRAIVFDSTAPDLSSALDTNGQFDVYARDMIFGLLQYSMVSTSLAFGDSGAGESDNAAVSADGRVVVFTSNANNLVSADNNGLPDVFARNTFSGPTALASINSAGTDSGNNESLVGEFPEAHLSADGRILIFTSPANNLVANDTNATFDIFARDLMAGTTTLVSINAAGNDSGNGRSLEARISANGQFVAFTSEAGDLVTNDSHTTSDIFERDLLSGMTTLVSINSSGTDSGNSDSDQPSLSHDGQSIAFRSSSDDLVAKDSNSQDDIFLRETAFFLDDFEDHDASDWVSTGHGTWSAITGALEGTAGGKLDSIAPFSGCLKCTIQTDVKIKTPGGRASIYGWFVNKKDKVELMIFADKNRWILKRKLGSSMLIKQASNTVPVNVNEKYLVTMTFDGSRLRVFVDSTQIFDVPVFPTDPHTGSAGYHVKSRTGVPTALVEFGGMRIF